MGTILYFVLPLIAMIPLTFLFGFFTVKQRTAVIVERFGRYQSVRQAGLQYKIPFVDKIVKTFSLKIQQLDITVETKTKENTFVTITIAVEYKVAKDMLYEAYYTMERPHRQMVAHITKNICAEVPKMTLNDVFENKDSVVDMIKESLAEELKPYGYIVLDALATDVEPDRYVKNAMNRISAADIEKSAAEYEAETMRINMITKAKAEAESKKIETELIADQRLEIAKSLMESIELFSKKGISFAEASALLMLSQHYDTLQKAANSDTHVMIPASLQESRDMINNMIATLMTTNSNPKDDSGKIIRFPNPQRNQHNSVDSYTN